DVVRLDAAQPHHSGGELADGLRGRRVGTRPRRVYETVLPDSVAAPVAPYILLALAIPPALVPERGGRGGRVFLALCLGLGFLLTGGIFSALGASGRISPLAAAVTAPVAFAVFGLLQLRRSERS